jgi:hypothetical protein
MRKSGLASVLLAILLLSALLVYVKGRERGALLGERLEYQIEGGGFFLLEVSPQKTLYRGVKCYNVRFEFSSGSLQRSGSYLMDEKGGLRFLQVQVAENAQGTEVRVTGGLEVWAGLNKVHTSWISSTEGVVHENFFELPPNLSTPEHFLMLVRFRNLKSGYYEEFSFLQLPIPTEAPVNAQVIGSETVRTPAGEFECRVLQLGGGWNARLWVSEYGVVARFQEDNLQYNLKSRVVG